MGSENGEGKEVGKSCGRGRLGFDGRVCAYLGVYLYIMGHLGCRMSRSQYLGQTSEVPVFPSSDHMVPSPFYFGPKLSKFPTPHVHRIRKVHIHISQPRAASTTPRN